MKRMWKEVQLIGFSIKNLKELTRVISFKVVNMVELKPEGFAKSGMPFYAYKDGRFEPNYENLQRIKQLADGLVKQIHLPIEKGGITMGAERGLNIGVEDHHDIYLDKFRMMEAIYLEFGIGSVLTFHPPLTSVRGKQIIDDDEALIGARKFFEKLDALRLKDGHQTLVGLENQSDPKILGGNLGYLPAHFKKMLKPTRTIGLTLDSGHRRLTRTTEKKMEFRTRDFLALGIPINNIHFHGNSGQINLKNFDDDEHLLPRKENVNGYENYLRHFRRYRTPLVLEIAHLERYSDEELREFMINLKKELV